MEIIKQYKPREYSAFMSDNGVVLCDKEEGAFLVLRFSSDLQRLKDLLAKIVMVEADLTDSE